MHQSLVTTARHTYRLRCRGSYISIFTPRGIFCYAGQGLELGYNYQCVPTGWSLSRVLRKPDFCICENKTQISFPVTAQLISTFVFTTQIVQSTYFLQNLKPLAILCGCTAWFVWGMVGNPEARFSHNEAQGWSLC